MFHSFKTRAAAVVLTTTGGLLACGSEGGTDDLFGPENKAGSSAEEGGAPPGDAGRSSVGGDTGGGGTGGAAPPRACASDRDCTPHGLLCLVEERRCVECVADRDCDGDNRCIGGACRAPCASDNICTPRGQLCDFETGTCQDPPGTGGAGGAGGSGGTPPTTTQGVDLFILMDVSGSMSQRVGEATRWEVVRTALIEFLESPASAGVATGIAYFPGVPPGAPASCMIDADCVVAAGNFGTCESLLPIPLPGFECLTGCQCSAATGCTTDAYSSPTVPITHPASAAAVIESLQSRPAPNGQTPMRYALEGAHRYVADWASRHPARRTILTLIGDGEPQGCMDNTVADSEAVVRTAFEGSLAIPTFVVGIGPSLENLNVIAVRGGTSEAYLMSDTAAVTELPDAMADILRRARSGLTP